MRLTRLHVVLAAGVVAVSGSVAGAAMGLASAAPTASHQVVLVQCNGKGQVKPSSTFQPGCMGSNQDITALKWSSWSSSGFATGTFGVNDCTPSSKCGPSQFTKFPILAVLWRPAAWPGHAGRHFFSRLTVIFTGSGKHFPKGAKAVQTFDLRA
jgi:hypothetical protein